jgi:hypothetical protein
MLTNYNIEYNLSPGLLKKPPKNNKVAVLGS